MQSRKRWTGNSETLNKIRLALLCHELRRFLPVYWHSVNADLTAECRYAGRNKDINRSQSMPADLQQEKAPFLDSAGNHPQSINMMDVAKRHIRKMTIVADDRLLQEPSRVQALFALFILPG